MFIRKEITHHCPFTPYILVGNKADLLEDRNTLERLAEKKLAPIYWENAQAMAKAIGAAGCYYSSALTGKGLQEAMGAAIRTGLKPYTQPPEELAAQSKSGKNCLLQ